jgi:hypothetical protein
MFSLVQSIEKEFMERVSKNEAGDAPHGTADNDKANAAGYNLYPVFGVHSGLCNVGNYGSARRLKYGITGDTFDTAKRLLAMCKKGQVQLLVSGATEEMVHAQFLRKYVATVQVDFFPSRARANVCAPCCGTCICRRQTFNGQGVSFAGGREQERPGVPHPRARQDRALRRRRA